MGTDGMRYSLPSRDVIADSIESVSVVLLSALLAHSLHWIGDDGE